MIFNFLIITKKIECTKIISNVSFNKEIEFRNNNASLNLYDIELVIIITIIQSRYIFLKIGCFVGFMKNGFKYLYYYQMYRK